jgi:hypothetical protein
LVITPTEFCFLRLAQVNAAGRPCAAPVKVEGCAFRPFRYPRC